MLMSHESGRGGICRRRAFVASCVMLPRGIPRGTSREGETQFAGRVLDWIIPCQPTGMPLGSDHNFGAE